WDTGLRLPWGDSQAGMPLLLDSFLVLLVVRFLFGAGEAGALPNNARVVARWFPLSERGLVQGVVLTCMQLGGACAPIVTGELIARVGWRQSFFVLGSLGLIWGALFYQWFRDDPAEHASVNEGELKLIRTGNANAAESESHPPIPWKLVLCSPTVWLLGTIMN